MKHRIFAAALLAGLSAGVGAASGALTVASFPDLDRAVKTALPLWQKTHPEIPVKLVSLQIEDHHNSMTTALAAGARLPDVMAIDFGYIGIFAESKGLEDLLQAPYGAGQYRKQFVSYTSAQATGSRGNLAALPADIGPGLLFYRKDLLDKAGVGEAELTRSWESYIEAGRKLKAATGVYLLSRAADLKDIYIRANLKDGEGLYFGDKGRVLVDTPRFARAFELAKAARAAGIDAKTVLWTSEWSEGFKRDKVASQMMGSWLSGHLSKWLAPGSAGKWRAAPLPGGALASYGGSFYAIPKKAANKEAAWEFIKFMTINKEVQLNALREIAAYPALTAAHADAAMDEAQPYFGGQKTRLLARDAAARIPVIRVDKYDTMANEVVNAELDKVLVQNKDIKTALQDAKDLIERRARR
ncbi:extracellular solute-binding protein [Pseudoduganella violacea]|uniref:Multiple sugar transport system substrate-binding protein n=1 Tax=Pseudoduganella violacea TaxID=1715466 RepID=A0A7W5BAT6_9BURK|nr:extracellular solute-binding protein [Pseudoduganella violacea]MBB3119568.1 multiple sugar transport system substrate-binding protein [Pseudoduganella violacea]